jgi:hypothetical protein
MLALAPESAANHEETPMPDTDILPVEVDKERRVVRRDGKQIGFDRDFEWHMFVKLFEAGHSGRPCTVASLASGMSALLFFSALSWLKQALEPLNLTVVQFDGPNTKFQLFDVLELEEVTPLSVEPRVVEPRVVEPRVVEPRVPARATVKRKR